MHTQFDIVVSGAGPAGLIAAAAFGAEGFTVLCLDPAAPVVDGAAPDADLRTTAFLAPARALLTRAGLWSALAPHAVALETMRIVDAAATPPVTRDFVAAEISDDMGPEMGTGAFGWNIRNWALRGALIARLAEMPAVSLRIGTGYCRHLARDREVLVTLSDGTTVSASLLIGADGRASPVRRGAGIDVQVRRFGQKALSFCVTHAAPHGNISTEIHRDGGPFTLVPLPDTDGRPASAVVWMTDGPTALHLAALDDAAFDAAATERSGGLLGDLRAITRRQVWPITVQRAASLTAARTALVAEAAHAVPPIGAQGLNMSLADIATLRDLAVAAPADLGSAAMLTRYTRARTPDLALRLWGIEVLNLASRSAAAPVQALRALGLCALHDVAPVRRGLMKLGLGDRSGA